MDEPKLFQHLTDLYNHLVDESVHEGVYEGSQRKTFDKLGLSNAMNPILYRALREMGCIEMMQRGGGGRPTILKLVKPPQIEQFREWNRTAMMDRALTPRTSLATLEQSLRLLEKRLPQGVDLPQYILAVEGRLTDIESRLGVIEKERASGKTAKRSTGSAR